MSLHRNSQKRFYQENSIYFIVTKTFENFPYFKEPIFCNLFIEDLKICKELKKFKLYGFCLIYDHLNLLIHPSEEFNVSKIIQNIKRTTSLHINQIISENIFENGNNSFEGDNIYCRLQKDFVIQTQNQFLQKYGKNQTIIPKFRWQKSYRDHIIRNEKDFQNHYHYTVYNFQKHNLPDDWKYTSLNYKELVDGIVL